MQENQNLLQELEEEENIDFSNEDSEVDNVLHSDHCSESEQSDEEMIQQPPPNCLTYTGKDQVSKWRIHALPRNVRTRQQNIVKHLPGVRAEVDL